MKDSILPPNEYLIYILRKTNLNRKEIRELTLHQFWSLYNEVYYQELVDEWRNQYSIASILAAIYNTIPRKRGSRTLKVSDFLKGEMPQRITKPQDSIEKMAEDRGIKLPIKELRER